MAIIKHISLIVIVVVTMLSNEASGAQFDKYYNITWGKDHIKFMNDPVETLELKIDNKSGAGFESKLRYASGIFQMRMKIPTKPNTMGIVISFYLHSLANGVPNRDHDELDLEFLGAKKKPWTLQTNVFNMDDGFREQKIKLGWFNPTTDFHNYTILWNQHQVVFFVDEIPIRVFKNHTKHGLKYPSHSMWSRASIWDGTPWESGGPPVNWTHGPSFEAYYQGFNIDGCVYKNTNGKTNDYHHCYDTKHWWNAHNLQQLDHKQQEAHDRIRKKYLFYDYCKAVNAERFKECKL